VHAHQVGVFPLSGVLGAGSFGTVYLGTDPATHQPVAVKVLDRHDAQLRERLRAEATAMRQIDDPHCVRVVAVIDEPDVAAIVTEFIDGAPLRAVLQRAGRLTGPQACHVMRGALRGLVAVHAAGLLHGDIKPDNVLVDRHGVSLLIDFGLAAAPRSAANRAHYLAGSSAYLSPEQIRGESADVRSDVYACAVVLYELLCGQRPYLADRVEAVLDQHLWAAVPDPRWIDPTITAAFARLCVSGLAKDPALRPQSAAEFLALLEDAADERYGHAWRAGAGLGALAGALVGGGLGRARAAAFTSRPVRAALGVGAAAVVATGAVIALHTNHSKPPVAAPPRPSSSTPATQRLSGHLVVTTGSGRTISVLNPDGTAPRLVPSASVLCCYAPALSPDGSLLLTAGEGTVSVGKGDGSAQRVVWASPTLSVTALTWSPNGTRIAFAATDPSTPVPSSDLDVINADGSNARTVARDLNIHSIAWSPDGSQLAFAANQGGIFVQSATGGSAHDVLRSDRILPGSLSWAPGHSLLFSETGVDPNGTWIINTDGSGTRSILPGATSPSWAPDGTHFAAVANGRVVIALLTGQVVSRIGPADTATVQWGG
jgi:predicted Ser/Thr protein kinase